MSNFKKILVALDGSNNSFKGLDAAIYLARQAHATLTGIFVFPPTQSVFQPIRYDRKIMQKEGNHIMGKAKIRAAQKGIVFRHKITSGNPGLEIANVVNSKRNKFDLVVIGSRGLGGAKELFLGSVANYVLHKSKIPVLVVK